MQSSSAQASLRFSVVERQKIVGLRVKDVPVMDDTMKNTNILGSQNLNCITATTDILSFFRVSQLISRDFGDFA
jgi:hypothetical protein